MNQLNVNVAPANGASTAEDLFALTDEQILEIEPAGANDGAGVEQPLLGASVQKAGKDNASQGGDDNDRSRASAQSQVADKPAQPGAAVLPAEPPRWLAEQMADRQGGAEARELWDGVQRARQEAAAYREVFARPEDARTSAERARALDEIDAAFYGATGKSAEELGAARAALTQRLMQEDPAAFREMVFAGLRALEEAGRQGRTEAGMEARGTPRQRGANTVNVPSSDPRQQPGQGPSTSNWQTASGTSPEPSGRLGITAESAAAYRIFEKAANEELERSVGNAIERTLEQALPGAARSSVGLHARIVVSVRESVDAALRGDAQLGEQVAQVLASRRFDDATRAQVVRLINGRAEQLVPGAAKRVMDDWTQTTLAAHRAKTQKAETGANRDLGSAEPSSASPRRDGNDPQRRTAQDAKHETRTGRIDYRKLSDEQILDF